MSITLVLPPQTEHELRERASRAGQKLDQYIAELLAYSLAKTAPLKKNDVFSDEESALFRAINQGFDEAFWQRLSYLKKQLEEGEITADERNELLSFNEQLEIMNVERMKAVSKLAELKGEDIDEVMQQLGLKPHG